MTRILSILLVGTALLARPTFGQEVEPVDSAASTAADDSIAAAAIQVSDLANQTGEIARRLRAADALTDPDPNVTEIEDEWAEFTAMQDELERETEESLAADASDAQLDELLRRWQIQRQQLERWEDVLADRIDELNREVSGLTQARESWTVTRSTAVRDDLPAPFIAQIDTVLVAIDEVASRLRSRLDVVLELHGRLTFENVDAVAAQESLGKFQADVLTDRLSRLDKPLWRVFSDEVGPRRPSQKPRIVEAAEISGRYLAERPGYGVLHIGFLLVLLFAFRVLGRRLAQLAAEDSSLEASARIFEKPWLPATLIALIATPAIYPVVPASLVVFATLVSIPITIYLLLRQLPQSLHRMLYGLGVLVLLFVVARAAIPSGSVVERLAMFTVATVSLVSAAWFLRPGGTTDVLELTRLGRLVISACRAGLIILVVSIVADVLGYVDLAHHGTRATMVAIYFGLYFYVGALIIAGGAVAFVRTRFPQRSRTIKAHTTVIQDRLSKLIFLVAGAYWLFRVFDNLGLSDPILGAVTGLLGRPFGIGDVEISLIDILAFVITLWISLKGAQIIRAILDEDILGRMELPRGLPVTISGLTFYFLVALGFVFALSAAGVPLDRLALITGALGIGIGFGLQDIVRNFISGLILMIERPIKVGDTIEFGSQTGIVMKIGIRASVVRAFEGADVIVPNGQLVTNEVRNWTMADTTRRISVSFNVAYGTDPTTIPDLIVPLALEHPKVDEQPKPVVLFTEMGDSSLNFELRVWTSYATGWPAIRSDLTNAIYIKLGEAGIKIPFPQRDLNVRSVDPDVLKTSMLRGDDQN